MNSFGSDDFIDKSANNYSKEMYDYYDTVQKQVNHLYRNIASNFDKMMTTTDKKDRKRREAAYKIQMKQMEDLSSEYDEIFGMISDSMDDLGKEVLGGFFDDQKKNLKVFNTLYNKNIKQETKSMNKFWSSFDDSVKNGTELLGNLSQVTTALNVGSIKDSIEETNKTTVDSMREIKKKLNFSDAEMALYKEDLLKMYGLSKEEYGGKLSRTDLTEAVAYAVKEVGIVDPQNSIDYGRQLAIFKAATGEELQAFEEVAKVFVNAGWSTSSLKSVTDDIVKLSSNYSVSNEALASGLSTMSGDIYTLANGDESKFLSMEESLLKSIAIIEDTYMDSSKILDTYNSSYSDFIEKYAILAKGGADVNKIYQLQSQGNYSDATSMLMNALGEMATDKSTSREVKKQVMNNLDLTDTEWAQIAASYKDRDFNISEAMQNIMNSSKDGADEAINESTFKNIITEAFDSIGLTGPLARLATAIEGMDFDTGDIVGGFTKLIGTVSIGKSAIGKIGEIFTSRSVAKAATTTAAEVATRAATTTATETASVAVKSTVSASIKAGFNSLATSGALDLISLMGPYAPAIPDAIRATRDELSDLVSLVTTGKFSQDTQSSIEVNKAIKAKSKYDTKNYNYTDADLADIKKQLEDGASILSIFKDTSGNDILEVLDKIYEDFEYQKKWYKYDGAYAISEAFSEFYDKSKDGSHANGLARVPYDGYRAELHKDETVLTKAQAKVWRKESSTKEVITNTKTADMNVLVKTVEKGVERLVKEIGEIEINVTTAVNKAVKTATSASYYGGR